MFSYLLRDFVINYCDEFVIDLDFKLTSSLDPGLEIESICCKAYKISGFIIRLTKVFGLKSFLKVLYCTLVRPILKYCVIIRDAFTAVNAHQLVSVQHMFLRYASSFLSIACPPYDYSPTLSSYIRLAPLVERRRYFGSNFLIGLLAGDIDSITLLFLISLKVPQHHSRSTSEFHVLFNTTNYLNNEPIRRMFSNASTNPTFKF